GDVDRDGAPGDAAAATDAAGAAELVVPGAELVGQPLAVAGSRRLPDRAAVDVRVVDREARVPDPGTCNGSIQVVRVLDGGAEARRARHRAVAAREAAVGDLVPARMLEVVAQEVADVARVELPPHPGGGVVGLGRRRGAVHVGRVAASEFGENLLASVAARLDQE